MPLRLSCRRFRVLLTAALGVAVTPAVTLAVTLAFTPQRADAQYFGRNKVQYDRLDFRVLSTPHFRVHFYPAESLAVADAARMAERWYVRLHRVFDFEFTRSPIIFYADPPDFQQSNVVEGEISQGTGGITEGLRERVIMPLTGSYAETDHVLGHELVHVFQYRIATASKGGVRAMGNIPLWLIEGMAEYLSVGRDDPNTAMWLRDAVRRNDLPTITQLTNDRRYFPYRYGQALWAFIGGTWGDAAVNTVFRAALEKGWEQGVASTLGIPLDTLSARWHTAIRTAYADGIAARTAPSAVGQAVALVDDRGQQNISPAVSPDGRTVAYFSSRGLFGIDLYLADVASGRIIRQLTSVTRDAHYDALSFLSSAGAWSPDGRQLAFVVYNEGDQEIDLADVSTGAIVRRITASGITVPGITAMTDPAWSPDGKSIAFSGFRGGISDLYVYDLTTGKTAQLTDDRNAQLQPAWSPDGTLLAYATDAGDGAEFSVLRHPAMRLAVMEVATRQRRWLPRADVAGARTSSVAATAVAPDAKQINPQFSADGRTIYFVSDVGGVSNLFGADVSSGAIRRITNVATGVSSITALSPAISVARNSGDLLFSVFDQQGYGIHRLTPADLSAAQQDARGPTATAGIVDGGVLPPMRTVDGVVSAYLRNAAEGLPAPRAARITDYEPSLALDYVGGPQIGVATGAGYGTGVSGGVAFAFSDQLRNHSLQTVVQAQGDLRDIGGQAMYLNRTHRWNWGLDVSHVPLVGGFGAVAAIPITVGGETFNGTVYTQQVQRQYFQTAQAIAQYPLSATRRVELRAGGQRIAFNRQVDSAYVIGTTVVREARNNLGGADPLLFATASAAYVGDYSFAGLTSPVAGARYRFELTPTLGSIDYTTALADYRRYLFARPFTLAFRGLHVGRYGSDASSTRLQPFFVGQPFLIRGYDVNSFDASECGAVTGNDRCPALSRLAGARVAVLNAEFRIPLLGPPQLSVIPFRFVPLEVSPFVDAGLAWSGGDDVALRFDRHTTDRVPVFSAGASARVNLLGYAVLEAFWARPFQRPQRNGVWGFQLRPGW